MKRYTDSEKYEAIKRAAQERAARITKSGRDIGDIPECVHPKRKASCKKDLMKFLKSYFPEKFQLDWSDDHKVVIAKIEKAVLEGGLFALAMPRSTGKTTICERAALWAALYAHRKFIALIGATEEAACQLLDEIKMEIESNERLQEDFPEVCFPVRKLDGIQNRCNGQTCNGTRTRITWTDNEVIFPTIADCATSGLVIQVRGITGRIRGMKAATATGKSLRPDLVLIDDPQTDESAASNEQNRKRLKILSGAILGLSGPGVKIAGVMPCTVIRPGDMADEILNRERHPEWNGERRKMLVSFPENMDLWNKYAEIWADSLRDTGTIQKATDFYREHQLEMDKGASVSWKARYQQDEISGIQNAMNLYFRDKETFFSEYQNEPVADDAGNTEKITEENLFERMNGRKRKEIPRQTDHLIMYIDVQKNLLYWMICAFQEDFTGYIVDYNAFPDQKRRYFTLKEANPSYSDVFNSSGWEGALYSALDALVNMKMQESFFSEDGTEFNIEKILIDSAWGESTNTIYRFCEETPYQGIVSAAKGRGITAAQKPISEYKKMPGEKIGMNWRIFRVRGSHQKIFEIDTNFWKSFFRQRLFSAIGDKGSFTVFGKDREIHRALAEHFSSEFSIETVGIRKVDIWKMLPGRENHWLDCAVGCMAAASWAGCSLLMNKEAQKNNRGKATAFKKNIYTGRIIPHR